MPTSRPAPTTPSARGQLLRVANGVPRLATGLALCVVLYSVAPTVEAAQAAPIAQSTGGPTGGDCFLGICDPATWLQEAVGRILANVLGGLIGGLGSIPGAIAAFPNDTDFLLRTPEALSYRNDQVQQFVSATRVLANGLLAVVTLVSGYNVL